MARDSDKTRPPGVGLPGCGWPAHAPGLGLAKGYHGRVLGKTRVQELKSLPLNRVGGARRSRRLGLRLGVGSPGACKVAGSCCDHQRTPSRCDHMVQPKGALGGSLVGVVSCFFIEYK